MKTEEAVKRLYCSENSSKTLQMRHIEVLRPEGIGLAAAWIIPGLCARRLGTRTSLIRTLLKAN